MTVPLPDEARAVGGLHDVSAGPLVRVPIRTRGGSLTLSAWRLEVTSAEGSGAIVLVEAPMGETYYRGEGIFLGWPQERLADVYLVLQSPEDGGGPDIPQLG